MDGGIVLHPFNKINIMKQVENFFWMFISSLISVIIFDTIKYRDYNAAVAVIEQVKQDEPDYFYDVLVETEVYQQFKNN